MDSKNGIYRWRLLRKTLRNLGLNKVASGANLAFAAADCREVLKKLPSESINCVVTSPPYGGLKDYGAAGQIGFGQEWETEYLVDLNLVLLELWRICQPGAALWLVLDTIKEAGKTKLLPWEVAHRAVATGWIVKDIVIWDKGRSLPWSHNGQFRGVFEYVLLLGKGGLSHFDMSKARDLEHLSSYWVRYPERYNPQGKAPTDLWHFPIPVQGSWSRNGLRHSCPFPLGLVGRMIALTTRPGDIIMDPFAGTGAVLVAATHLRRRALGFDMNRAFVERFQREGRTELKQIAKTEIRSTGRGRDRQLGRSIVKLRLLKYPKAMFAQLMRPDCLGEDKGGWIAAFLIVPRAIYVQGKEVDGKVIVGSGTLFVFARRGARVRELRSAINLVVQRPPLSKYGITVDIEVLNSRAWNGRFLVHQIRGKRLYQYDGGVFHSYAASISGSQLIETIKKELGRTRKLPPILSTIGVRIPHPISE